VRSELHHENPGATDEPRPVLKLRWLAWQPTPYNDVLFRTIEADPEFALTVYYRLDQTSTHPWQKPLRQGYASKIYRGRGLRLDLDLLKLALRENDSVFVLAGWPGLTSKAIILLLSSRQRRFIFWTDTPQVRHIAGKAAKIRIQELIADNTPYPAWHALMRRCFYRLVFARAGAVMTTGKPGLDAYLALGCPRTKLVTMPFFVDLPAIGQYEAIQQKFAAVDPFVFVAAGQLVHRKGYDIAVNALGLLRKKTAASFRFLILGNGPERGALEALSRTNGVTQEVAILGWQEPDEVRRILSESHVFVHPARHDPFPVAVLEAMAAGLPVLGSESAGSVTDRVVSGRNGLIHARGDAEALADQMLKVLSHRHFAADMAKSARSTAEEWPPSRALAILKRACDACYHASRHG
jgi:glycosyltransferase involved in cell wall biosynthesis